MFSSLNPRTKLIALFSFLAVLLVLHSFYASVGQEHLAIEIPPPVEPSTPTCTPQEVDLRKNVTSPGEDLDAKYGPTKQLVGAPTAKASDNLRKDRRYVTSGIKGGFTNQYINLIHIIYLGMQSDRTPIIPPFAPDDHIPHEAGIVQFGDLFNLTTLRKQVRTPLVEWSDVKILPNQDTPWEDIEKGRQLETIGCWSARPQHEHIPWTSGYLVRYLGMDTSYTRVPNSARRWPTEKIDIHVTFGALSALVNSQTYGNQQSSLMSSSPILQAALEPNTQLACFDLLYYATSSDVGYEWQSDWTPAWKFVGQYARFTSSIVRLTMGYVKHAFDIQRELPPFIAVHIRRGDFKDHCEPGYAPHACLAPLSAYIRRAEEVRQELHTRGILVGPTDVFVTSDEEDPAFWNEVKAQGWKFIDHSEELTVQKFNKWYPPIIDIVGQSLAIGFVGTDRSTVSMVSKRRVEEWNGGVSRMVKWGRPGADD
ncbi:hypothetical protein BDN72DRAFT_955949 [Pluteus cervinus]|uniref:Uncharacterized protein n=1 Tax=Pluteus cervinus TaxID=181527 RepID=A0ACD3B926_9AGAR|nr:hypothetical protein BDN72DRAFT_955949 [Pluteus cervinus]